MQKIATQVFIFASLTFGLLGVIVILTQPDDNNIFSKILFANGFVVLSSFALSVAGKYLKEKS